MHTAKRHHVHSRQSFALGYREQVYNVQKQQRKMSLDVNTIRMMSHDVNTTRSGKRSKIEIMTLYKSGQFCHFPWICPLSSAAVQEDEALRKQTTSVITTYDHDRIKQNYLICDHCRCPSHDLVSIAVIYIKMCNYWFHSHMAMYRSSYW